MSLSSPPLPDSPGSTLEGRLRAVVMALLCAAIALLAARGGFVATSDSQAALAAQGLQSFSSALTSLLARNEALPRMLALDPRLSEVLARPQEAGARSAANDYLEAVVKRGDLLAAYVLDATGTTLAASNWRDPRSFIGHNYSYRPYFLEAMRGGTGRFYAIGGTSGQPGYYLAAPLRDGARVTGVIVVKVDLQVLQGHTTAPGATHVVMDRYGVLFLTPDDTLRYHPFTPLSAEARAELAREQTYLDRLQPPLVEDAPPQSLPSKYLLHGNVETRVIERGIGTLGWRVVTFVDTAPAYRAALAAGAGGATLAALVGTLAAMIAQRRRRAAEIARSHEALLRSQARLRAVADGMPIMVCFIDRDDRYVFANQAYARRHGRTPGDIEGRPTSEVLTPAYLIAVSPHLARARKGETSSFEREIRDASGSRWFVATYHPVWNEAQDEVIGVQAMIQENTETRRRLDELSQLTQVDHLTQLVNRKGFDMRLEQALAEEPAGEGHVALLFIDLDDFKAVNDTWGHPAGDALLQAFSRRLERLVRAGDTAARMGGDEFAVLLRDVPDVRVLDRLAHDIADMAARPFDVNGIVARIGASVGIAVARSGDDAATLCARADAALYQRKKQRGGRDARGSRNPVDAA